MRKRQWLSAHLFYYEERDRLISNALQPLVEDLLTQQRIQCCFFIRYWQGGPHVRLRLLPSTPADAAPIRAEVEQRAAAFFATQPAQNTLSIAHYAKLTAHLSQYEYGEDRRGRMYRNNSLRYIRYRPEYDRYGGTAAMPIVEQHFMESSAIAFDIIRTTTGTRRSGQALAMMLAAMTLCTDDTTLLSEIFARNYRSWVQSLGAMRQHYEPLFAKRYAAQRPRLLHIAAQVLEMPRLDAAPAESPMQRWRASMQAMQSQLSELSRRDLLDFGPTARPPVNPLPIREPRAATVMLRCLHMHNNRLGIPFYDEAYLAYLLTHALAELAARQTSAVAL